MDRRNFLGGAIAGAAAFAGAKQEETRGELKTAQFAIVEMMGYKRLCGRLSQGIAGLLQLDIPVEGGQVTQMINPASIYRITFVSEAVVRETAKHVDPLPEIALEIQPVQRSLGWRDDRDDRDDDF